jgi:hypothetical protein
MVNVTVRIDLRGGEPEGGVLRFEPGSRLEGVAELMSGEAVNCRRAVLRVGWHTRSNGDTDQATIGELPMAAGALAANTHLVQPFAVDLPRAPWSYSGLLIKIVWEAELVLDMPLGVDLHSRQPFLLAPRR